MFYAAATYPENSITSIAVVASQDGNICDSPATPCGACRQVMLETENRYGYPMRILLCGEKEVYVIKSAKDLLPLAFDNY